MNINNITVASIVTFIIVQLVIINKPFSKEPNVTNSFIEASKDFIKKIEVRGEKRIILIGKGEVYDKEGNPINFQDKTIIDFIRKEFAKKGYTVITLGSNCLGVGCKEEYSSLALSVLALQPEAVVLHSVSSGSHTDILNNLFKQEEIPVYVYGRDLPIDYSLFVGPDNKKLGEALALGLLPKINKNSRMLYIETVTNGDISDNGYIRINTARNILSDAGAIEVDTLFTSWSETKTYAQVKIILESGKSVDYIITPSLETAEGAIRAIKELGLESAIKVVSMDFNPTIAALIKNNFLYATVSQEFSKQSNALASAIISQITNNILPPDKSRKRYASPIITKDNLSNYVDQEGNYIF